MRKRQETLDFIGATHLTSPRMDNLSEFAIL
jgi:hypothetical protein